MCHYLGWKDLYLFAVFEMVTLLPIRYIFMSSIPQNLIIFANLQLPTFFFKEQSPKIKFVNNLKKNSLDSKLEKMILTWSKENKFLSFS